MPATKRPIKTRFLSTAPYTVNLATEYSVADPLYKRYAVYEGAPTAYACGFRIYFTPLTQGFFSLSLTVLDFTIGQSRSI